MKKELRLLVVDDQAYYSDFLEEFADVWNEQFELVLHHVHSTEEAISQLGELRPNVIMVDAHLPDVNTFEFVEQCSSGSISLVLTSEKHSQSLEESALQRGATAYMPKTNDPDEVEFILERLAELSGAMIEFH